MVGSVAISDQDRELALQLIVAKLNTSEFFLRLYNLASYLSREGHLQMAKKAFEIIAGLVSRVDRQLAGKSHFKLSTLTEGSEERLKHLEDCIRLYPAHETAQKQLYKMAGQATE
jgi:hypothetical protein